MSPLRGRQAASTPTNGHGKGNGSGGGPTAATAAVVPRRPSADDLWLFGEGRHHRLWEVLGAHHDAAAGGTTFAVWAPAARAVAVVGSWTYWSEPQPLERLEGSGVWWGFVAGVGPDELYKFEVVEVDGTVRRRVDPYGRFGEHTGGMASIVHASTHEWGDDEWMAARATHDPLRVRTSIYEVHLGSWRRTLDGQPLSYRDLATQLADHVTELGFTHVELLPIAEHPYEPSWGYQVSGYFAPTSRYGSPDDFRWFVDHLHQRGIGVIVDWVPAHFPKDDWALARFDGSPLYEHADPRRAEHPDWGTLEFDYTKPEVRNFLVANALYWLQELHVDGLRVDAVASMLYLDYSRRPGEWTPNVHGGNQDLDAVAFLQQLNTVVHGECPGVVTIAEESTAWDGVTRPVHHGGLGFTHKWNMGWMHDTLAYWETDPLYRRWHHNQVTFGLAYAWAEHFVLPFSHDEVVHLKKPLFGKMPGALEDEHFANLRALYAWMWAHPGRQLFFMGGELAERNEWSHERSINWDLLHDPRHRGIQTLIGALNEVQADHPALFLSDDDPAAFRWLEVDDHLRSMFAFQRTEPGGDGLVVCVANLGGVPQHGYRVGLCRPGRWRAALTTDDVRFGGHGGWTSPVEAEPIPWQGCDHSAVVAMPQLSVLYLVPG